MTTSATDPADTEGTSSTGMTTAISQTETAEASDYGGPEVTSDVDTSASQESSDGSSDGTGSDSGSSDSTGTDTGATTLDTGSAEGADYGAAPPRD